MAAFSFFYRGALWRVGFDLENLALVGEPAALAGGIYYSRIAHFDVSGDGSIAYRRETTRGQNALVWIDRTGTEESIPLRSGRYSHPDVSPDGSLLAVTGTSSSGDDIWTYSFARGELTQRTFDQSRETTKVWAPGMQYLYFEAGQAQDGYRLRLSGEPEIVQLTNSPIGLYPTTITPDGKTLIIDEWSGTRGDGNNLAAMQIGASTDIEYLMDSDFRESHPAISPDGSMLAYMSNLGGPLEVFVRPFPLSNADIYQASTGGDSWQPRWNADGTELFYRDMDDEIMYVVPVDQSDGISIGQPTALFSTAGYEFEGAGSYDYDPTRDRFLMIRRLPRDSSQNAIVLIQNWQELLEDTAESP